jgi:hypothetical protein
MAAPPTEPSAVDVQLLMKWGREFMAIGDLAAARVAFRRAAQAGDAAAALAMGSTYDPPVLQRIGALGMTPEPDQARTWYERARNFGSPEAPGRPVTRRDPRQPDLNSAAAAQETHAPGTPQKARQTGASPRPGRGRRGAMRKSRASESAESSAASILDRA